MTALDVPLGGAAIATGQEFRASRGSRIMARIALVYAIVATLHLGRRFFMGQEARGSLMITLLGLAAMAYLLRTARLTVHPSGVRWGWDPIGFRMDHGRIRHVTAYTDAIKVSPRRGMPWFLVARDWSPFPRMVKAFSSLNVPFEAVTTRAPFLARMQGYGLALDLLVLADVVIVTLLLVT